MSIVDGPSPYDGAKSLEEYAARNISTMSGGPIYGSHWPPNPQTFSGAAQQSNFGALAQQGVTPTQFAQLAYAQQANPYAGLGTGSGLTQVSYFPYPNEPIEDAGISAGEIIAHRAWRVCDNGLLQSMAVDTIWAPNEVMEGSPNLGLGVHAFKTASAALTEYGNQSHVAIGTVLLWGEVIEHEFGYRAEFGKVNSIDFFLGEKSKSWRWSWWAGWTRRDKPSELQRLRSCYGVCSDGSD